MQALLRRDDAAARLAIELYVYRARRYLGAFLAVLGGCDAVAFGGGVGENAPAIRAAILRDFTWAGIELDPAGGRGDDDEGGGLRCISAPTSAVSVWVVPVDEATSLRAAALTLFSKELRR
jgi:acetate kinase